MGDNTYHRADGKVETKICDMGECAERNEPTHDRKLHPVSERDGAHAANVGIEEGQLLEADVIKGEDEQ